MSIRSLGEAMILQSLEDLFDEEHRDESVEFFGGEEFECCAEIAELGLPERLKVVEMYRSLAAQSGLKTGGGMEKNKKARQSYQRKEALALGVHP